VCILIFRKNERPAGTKTVGFLTSKHALSSADQELAALRGFSFARATRARLSLTSTVTRAREGRDRGTIPMNQQVNVCSDFSEQSKNDWLRTPGHSWNWAGDSFPTENELRFRLLRSFRHTNSALVAPSPRLDRHNSGPYTLTSFFFKAPFPSGI
jgi:hypothetical protein